VRSRGCPNTATARRNDRLGAAPVPCSTRATSNRRSHTLRTCPPAEDWRQWRSCLPQRPMTDPDDLPFDCSFQARCGLARLGLYRGNCKLGRCHSLPFDMSACTGHHFWDVTTGSGQVELTEWGQASVPPAAAFLHRVTSSCMHPPQPHVSPHALPKGGTRDGDHVA
jgi:hypothetical protein